MSRQLKPTGLSASMRSKGPACGDIVTEVSRQGAFEGYDNLQWLMNAWAQRIQWDMQHKLGNGGEFAFSSNTHCI